VPGAVTLVRQRIEEVAVMMAFARAISPHQSRRCQVLTMLLLKSGLRARACC